MQFCQPDPVLTGSRSTTNIVTSDILPTIGGLDLRIAGETWKKLAESEARLHLMVELGQLEVGFPDVENFCLELESKYRSGVEGELREQGKKSPEYKVVKLCMELKMIDERKTNATLETERYKFRKQIEEEYGKNSRRARNLVKKLRQHAGEAKKTKMMTFERKMKHLRRKYREDDEEKIDKIPPAMSGLGLEGVSVFSKKKFDDKKVEEYDPVIIGDIELHDNERLILRLPPKFSIEENLPRDGLAMEQELANAKTRMTINKENEERLDDDDEGIGVEGDEEDEELEEEMERLEAEARLVYDPRRRTFDDRKRKVTDLQECARVTLPKPMDTRNEALVEMRRGTNTKVYEEYTAEVCNKKGEVKGNMTEEEKDGLKRLQKRMKEKEVVILKTDKSGKMCLVTWEEYEKMGKEHTSKDEEVGRKGIIEMEKQINGHVFFWSKMWGSGDAHGQRDRIIDSKVVSSEQLADLYLMLKDHKEGNKTRPVVTGCNSNTRGFSNCVSDLLESVNKASEEPYETNSSEDMLARIQKYNIKAEEIMREGREKILRKVMCEEHQEKDKTKGVARCSKLWNKKRAEMSNAEAEDKSLGVGSSARARARATKHGMSGRPRTRSDDAQDVSV